MLVSTFGVASSRAARSEPSGDPSAAAQAPTPPSVTLPRGGGALRAIGEKFTANPATGVGEFTVAVPLSPARVGGTPALALSWQSAQGNGDFGLGWQIPAGRVQRKTDDGIPRYADGAESDVFTLSDVDDLVRMRGADGSPLADDLSIAGFAVRRYRPRTEGSCYGVPRTAREQTDPRG
ncbi:SpvB/TcaC N-terminal domain-containing protein [Mycobacterium sp.]|uniref:SpvB/TcaC N-terminal domain-containing protein n=1 Tax=Mycobacterium sp. TaxID=1785 RepID=UPI003F9B760D